MRDRPSDTAHRRHFPNLAPDDVVDHVDEDKSNNAPANLRVVKRGPHTAAHNRARGLSKLRKALTMHKRGEKLY